MKKEITVRFEDLDPCPAMRGQESFFVEVLSEKYDVRVLTGGVEEPDVLIYSWCGSNNIKWKNCIRIYYTIEMDYPDFNMCDYAIGLSEIALQNRFFHLPVYVVYNDLLRTYERKERFVAGRESADRAFCSTVISNGTTRDPIYFDILNGLEAYRHVDSGGRFNNNIGRCVEDKIGFIKDYKFNLAVENTLCYGYVTEKLIEGLIAGTLPVYWGSDHVKEEFGTEGYININDFEDLPHALDYIKRVDNDEALYLSILQAKPRLPFSYKEWCGKLSAFLSNAIEEGKHVKYNMMFDKMYYERLSYYRMRNTLAGRLYRSYKRYTGRLFHKIKSR